MAKIIKTQAELLTHMRRGWADFKAFIQTLTEEELTGPADAAGWTAKDHLMHCAVWEDGVWAVLEHQPRHEQMGFDAALWEQGFDVINDVIWKQHREKAVDEVWQHFESVHQRLVNKIETMTDEDLNRPYSYYQPVSLRFEPVINLVVGNTFKHYEEHQPWIEAIVGQ